MAGSGLEGSNSLVDNLHVLVFEKYYLRMTSLPVDAMLPTFITKGLLRDNKLRGRIRSASSDVDKAELLLEPVYTSLKLCNSDLFMSLLDVMTIYADGSDDQEVTRLVCDINKELTPQQDVNKQNHPGELVVRRHVLPKDLLPRFKEEFATVCKEIMKTLESHIQQKHLSIDEIVNMLCTFRNGDTVFFDDDFIKSTKFCQISKSVLKRTTIYDYSALEFFINTINCEEAKETLRDFVKHFENSLMKKMNLLDDHEIYTSNDYSGLSFGNDQPLVIKYRGYSLLYDDQELIKKFVCEMFELVDFSVEFERIARGCIALIYRITDSVRRYLLEYRITGGKLASCAKYNILCFIIGDMQLKVPLGYVVTDEDAVVPWTRIIPESPEAHLSELVTEPDDSMHSTFSDSEMVPVTLALHSEEEKLMEPFTTVVGLPYTIGTSFCGGVSPKSVKSFVQEFPMQNVCQEITDQTDYGIDSYPVPVSAVPVVVDIDPHPQYDIYSYPVPESVVVVEHPIYKSSSVKNLSMARPVEETEEFLVGNLNLA